MEKIDKKAVGARIKAIRLDSGMTMVEFGEWLSTTQGAVSNWERGENLPNKYRIKRIATIANISVHDLLHGVKRYMYVITYSNYSGPIVRTDTYARVYTSLEAAKRDVARYEQGVPVDQDHRFSIEKMEVVE
ncbi:helix-turn-helix transcriptional regulator [Abiotrophia sp.]|uniref:helix-turn-helix domain-containing protein n=1 Tax=Abiotrophia sp. TaxID=76631 RepID=UPI001CB1EAF3|nr:helix-turn-helix transcriptional regulator [Abiotrophia sp.]MBF0936986.1 helix-turn-helix transcriptional regulator [Abiotrophia sp.]